MISPPITSSHPITGACACGAIRYALRSTPFDTGWCHCRICQRSSGAPALVFTTVPRPDFEILAGSELLRSWRSTKFGRRSFCSSCGTLLTMTLDFQADTIDIAAATLHDPQQVTPGFHVFCKDAIPWAPFDDGLPRHDGFRRDTRGIEPADRR